MSTPPAEEVVAEELVSTALSHRQIMTILMALLVGLFLSSLDGTIVNTAIRTIGDDLHGLSVQAWVTTGFLITSTVSMPLLGKLSDIYGRKPFLMLCIVIFVVGSALCGLATSMYMLAVFRAIQGIGAGGIFPLSMAIVGDIMAPRQRAKYQGYFVVCFSSAAVIGPVIGGFFAGTGRILGIAGWRWIFYINVPIGVVALLMVQAALTLDHERQTHRIDWGGAATLLLGLVPLLLIAEQGRTWGWTSSSAWACYLVGAAGIAVFIQVERRMGDEAMLPIRLFRIGTFAFGSAQAMVAGMVMYGGTVVLPLYLQLVKGESPTKAGLLMVPQMAGMMSASFFSGRYIARTGRYKVLVVTGGVLLTLGMTLLATVRADTSLVLVDIFMAIMGLGVAFSMNPMVIAMQNAVPAKDMGVATASTNFFRQVGGSVATAVLLTVLFSRAASEIALELAKAHVTLAPGSFDLNDTHGLDHLAPYQRHPILIGFAHAMGTTFLIIAVIAVFAIVFSVLMKEVPLRMVSGHEAARQELSAEALS